MLQIRQLAAITFTDIFGCAALRGDDELQTFELLKKNCQIQKNLIEEGRGKGILRQGSRLQTFLYK